MISTNTGISTVLFYKVLKNKQVDKMVDAMRRLDGYAVNIYRPHTDTYEYSSSYFADRGMVVTISQFNDSPWGLYVYINPAMVLGYNELYQPDKANFRKLESKVHKMLSKLHCPYRLKDMKLSKVSLAFILNLPSGKDVMDYLGAIRQAYLPHHYDVMQTELNRHLYCQCCKRMMFSACDAVGCNAIGMNHIDYSLPPIPLGMTNLWLQLTMRNKVIRRKVGGNALNHHRALMCLVEQAEEMFTKQFKTMKLYADSFVSYDEAVSLITNLKNRKNRERMLYLLKKTRDTGTLTDAVAKLKEKHKLNARQVNRVLRKFNKLGISPITLANSEEELPGFKLILEG